MAGLSAGTGQVTGWSGRGSGTAPEPARAGAQASRRAPAPRAAAPAAAPRGKPRRVMLRGCAIGHLVPAPEGSALLVRHSLLTDRSVKVRGTPGGSRAQDFQVKDRFRLG